MNGQEARLGLIDIDTPPLLALLRTTGPPGTRDKLCSGEHMGQASFLFHHFICGVEKQWRFAANFCHLKFDV